MYGHYILIKYLLITHQKIFELDSRQNFRCMNAFLETFKDFKLDT